MVVAGIEIRRGRNARLDGGLRKGVEHLPAHALLFNAPFAPCIAVAQYLAVGRGAVAHQLRGSAPRTMDCIGAAVMVFVQFEVRQTLLPSPTVVAQ